MDARSDDNTTTNGARDLRVSLDPPPVAVPPVPRSAAPSSAVSPADLDHFGRRMNDLEARLVTSEEENRALVRTLEVAARVSDQILAEAREDAAKLIETTRRDAAGYLAKCKADADATMATLLDGVRLEAGTILAGARTEAEALVATARLEASELVMVARSDARAAVQAERERARVDIEAAAAEIEAATAARTSLERDRAAFDLVYRDVHRRADELARSLGAFLGAVPEPEAVGEPVDAVVTEVSTPGQAPTVAAPVPTFPGPAAVTATATAVDAGNDDEDPNVPVRLIPGTNRALLASLLDCDDEMLEGAFAEFFSGEVDDEPSRAWMISE